MNHFIASYRAQDRLVYRGVFTMRIGTSIISAASLSFLGLGAQPPTPEWGAMLNEARADMVIAPHVAVFRPAIF